MQMNLLQPDMEHRGMVLDPRTKLLLLFTMAFFVLGGAAGNRLEPFMPVFCLVPFVLFCLAGRVRPAVTYLVVYAAAYVGYRYLGGCGSGTIVYILLGICGIFSRFLPSLMAGAYFISTTSVSEFTAAMERMHVTDKITIPLSVMFRFFPTVIEEFDSINTAMRMRDIRFGGKNVGKMLEYRIVPLLVCSAKIGEELNAAALTRGLGGEKRRTNICRIGFHVQDGILLLLCLVPYVVLLLEYV